MTYLIPTKSVLSSKIHTQKAPKTTRSHLKQLNGTASQGKDISEEISPSAGANFIPIIKAAVFKIYSYKLQYLLQVYAAYTETGDVKFCALTEQKISFTAVTTCRY